MKNKVKGNIRVNFFYNIIYEVFKIAIPLLTTPYIARILGPEGVGTFALAQTYALYFAMFASFGFSSYAVRELAYVRDDEEKLKNVFWEIFICKAVFCTVTILAYLVFVFKIDNHTDWSYKIYVLYFIELLLDTSSYFVALENFKTVYIRNILVKLLSLLSIFIFVKKSTHTWLYTLIIVLSGVIGQLVVFLKLDRFLFKGIKIDRQALVKHIKGSFALFVPTIAIQVYTLLDKAMLGHICGEVATGFYENSQKMVRLASTVASAIVSVSVPRVAYTYANGDTSELKQKFSRIFSFVSFLVFPMCFGLIAIADNFSSWYYGSEFTGIADLVKIGAPLIISLGWSSILGSMVLTATGNQKYFSISVYCGAVINVILNLILMPIIGAKGAIIASVLAEFSGMSLMFYFSNKLFCTFSTIVVIPKYLIFGGCVGSLVWILDAYLFKTGVTSTIIEVVVGGSVYLLIMYLLKDRNCMDIINAVKVFLRKILQH